jgi:iron complex transport system substrate-binding protein
MLISHDKDVSSVKQIVYAAMVVFLVVCSGCLSTPITTDYNQDIPKISAKEPEEIHIRDSNNNDIVIRGPVYRIVSLNAATTEMLVNIGAEEQIVGVADFIVADNHPGMRKRLVNATGVGSLTSPDIETILKLHPDVLMAYTNKPLNYQQMVDSGITVIQMSCYRPEELARDARSLGRLTGQNEQAERYAQFTERNLELIQERLQNISDHERPRVYMEYVNDYMAYGPGSGADRMLELLKAENIAGDLPGQNIRVSKEWVIEQNPDVIIRTFAPMKGNCTVIRQDIIDRPGFSNLNATRTGKIYCMTTGLVTTPRSVIGLLYLAKVLYPERFSDIDPAAILEEYKTEFSVVYDENEIFQPTA